MHCQKCSSGKLKLNTISLDAQKVRNRRLEVVRVTKGHLKMCSKVCARAGTLTGVELIQGALYTLRCNSSQYKCINFFFCMHLLSFIDSVYTLQLLFSEHILLSLLFLFFQLRVMEIYSTFFL